MMRRRLPLAAITMASVAREIALNGQRPSRAPLFGRGNVRNESSVAT
jgi:hypothetical protein